MITLEGILRTNKNDLNYIHQNNKKTTATRILDILLTYCPLKFRVPGILHSPSVLLLSHSFACYRQERDHVVSDEHARWWDGGRGFRYASTMRTNRLVVKYLILVTGTIVLLSKNERRNMRKTKTLQRTNGWWRMPCGLTAFEGSKLFMIPPDVPGI